MSQTDEQKPDGSWGPAEPVPFGTWWRSLDDTKEKRALIGGIIIGFTFGVATTGLLFNWGILHVLA